MHGGGKQRDGMALWFVGVDFFKWNSWSTSRRIRLLTTSVSLSFLYLCHVN